MILEGTITPSATIISLPRVLCIHLNFRADKEAEEIQIRLHVETHHIFLVEFYFNNKMPYNNISQNSNVSHIINFSIMNRWLKMI